MFTGIVLYRKSNGNEIVYSGTREDELMGYVRTKQGVTFAEQTIGSILARGYWQVVDEGVAKHGTHDQSSHNPHKGGRGSLAGGTTRTSAELQEKSADLRDNLNEDEIAAIEMYVVQGHNMNGMIREGITDGNLTDEVTLEDTIENLDSAIAAAPPVPNMAVWRVASVTSVEGLKVGQVVRDRGYASTTIADLTQPENGMMLLSLNGISGGRKVLVEINTGDGSGMFIPAVAGGATAAFEQEFLLPRDSFMEYLGVRDMPNSSLSPASVIHQFKVVNQ